MEQYQLLAQIDELKRRLEALAHENATLRAERDIAWAKVHALLPKATPEEEEELRRELESGTAVDGDELLRAIILDLEADDGNR